MVVVPRTALRTVSIVVFYEGAEIYLEEIHRSFSGLQSVGKTVCKMWFTFAALTHPLINRWLVLQKAPQQLD